MNIIIIKCFFYLYILFIFKNIYILKFINLSFVSPSHKKQKQISNLLITRELNVRQIKQ